MKHTVMRIKISSPRSLIQSLSPEYLSRVDEVLDIYIINKSIAMARTQMLQIQEKKRATLFTVIQKAWTTFPPPSQMFTT